MSPTGEVARTTRGLDRLSVAVAAVASTWFALAAAWELCGPFDAGHDAASAGVGIAAVEMWQWNSFVPVLHFSVQAPTNADYYCHHPWGVFWTTALLVRMLGPHDWVLRIAPVAMSAATPPLIFLGARCLWGAPAAALATAVFTVTPLAVAFADFNALEVPVIFGVALSLWALVRFRTSWRRRYLWVALLGLAHALNADWPAFVFAGIVLVLGLVRGTLLARRWYEPLDQRRFWLAWAWLSTLVVLVGSFYLGAFLELDQLEELLRQAGARSTGAERPLADILDARRHWIELSFTPVGIAVGKLAFPVLLVRSSWLRRDLEALPLAVLGMAAFQYVVFKQGADVHVFWPQYFALYLAYAVGAVVASVGEAGAWLSRGRQRLGQRFAAVGFAAGLALPVAMLPDAVATLGYARRTGKRFDDGWRLIHQDADKIALARSLRSRLGRGETVALHVGMKHSWALEWALRHPVQVVGYVPQSGSTLLVDSRFADAEFLRVLLSRASVSAYGPFWVARVASGPGPLDGYRLTRREPAAWERYLVDAHDPAFGFVPDQHWTWELRYHLGWTPNIAPAAARVDGERLRISHNIALAQGDRSGAAGLREELLARLHPIQTGNAAGLTLLGWEWAPSVAPRLRVYVTATGPTPRPWQLHVTSRVVAKPWSTVPAPDAVREVGMPFAIPSSLFRPGFIYVSESEIREQPGIERYSVQLRGQDRAGEIVPIFEL